MKKMAWACLILIGLPCAFLAFQEKPDPEPETIEAKSPETSETSETPGTPGELVEGYLGLLKQTKVGVKNLKESKPVRKMVDVAREVGPVLKKILKRAFAVPETEGENEDEGDPQEVEEEEGGTGCL